MQTETNVSFVPADPGLEGTGALTFKKEDLNNSGFATIPRLIETYYWSLREADLKRLAECHSAAEKPIWEMYIQRGTMTKEMATNVASLMVDFRIEFQQMYNSQYIVNVTHRLADGRRSLERFGIIEEKGLWKITGVRGILPDPQEYRHLPYPTHPSSVPIYFPK